eukprot:83549-Chlamydomonas_euryale.AAC.1
MPRHLWLGRRRRLVYAPPPVARPKTSPRLCPATCGSAEDVASSMPRHLWLGQRRRLSLAGRLRIVSLGPRSPSVAHDATASPPLRKAGQEWDAYDVTLCERPPAPLPQTRRLLRHWPSVPRDTKAGCTRWGSRSGRWVAGNSPPPAPRSRRLLWH